MVREVEIVREIGMVGVVGLVEVVWVEHRWIFLQENRFPSTYGPSFLPQFLSTN